MVRRALKDAIAGLAIRSYRDRSKSACLSTQKTSFISHIPLHAFGQLASLSVLSVHRLPNKKLLISLVRSKTHLLRCRDCQERSKRYNMYCSRMKGDLSAVGPQDRSMSAPEP